MSLSFLLSHYTRLQQSCLQVAFFLHLWLHGPVAFARLGTAFCGAAFGWQLVARVVVVRLVVAPLLAGLLDEIDPEDERSPL